MLFFIQLFLLLHLERAPTREALLFEEITTSTQVKIEKPYKIFLHGFAVRSRREAKNYYKLLIMSCLAHYICVCVCVFTLYFETHKFHLLKFRYFFVKIFVEIFLFSTCPQMYFTFLNYANLFYLIVYVFPFSAQKLIMG
ncbi:Uncharacterised protein [Candidatus Ornithobacterium hominis]|uniref:Uncharacterized protein n=1 Tax=Candidatus Ornithobacterium hominis TaxID=2497989 RepID=A0A383TZ52_9FLAO|nr:Uncharacterised protein [Candidatus Ornithobacterium hominis]